MTKEEANEIYVIIKKRIEDFGWEKEREENFLRRIKNKLREIVNNEH